MKESQIQEKQMSWLKVRIRATKIQTIKRILLACGCYPNVTD